MKRRRKEKEYRGLLRLSFDDRGQVTLLDEVVRMDMPTKGVKALAQLGYNKDSVRKCLEKFGWFGTDGDANQFYPGLDVQSEVIPKPEDFIPVPFRLLSETIVAAGTWRATDFSRDGVLKAALDKFLAKPVYYDHNVDLNNWLGFTSAVSYSASYVDEAGNKIPGGIDGVISIDGKTNPKFARGAYTGIITSTSVTIDFKWKPSHDMQGDMSEFNSKVGDYDEQGKMYTRVCTEVVDIYETSLVFKGADPYAKKLDENQKLIKPDFQYAVKLSREAKLEAESPEVRELYSDNKKFITQSALDEKFRLSLRSKLVKNQETDTKDAQMDPKLLLLLAFFGFKNPDEVTADSLAKFKLVLDGQEALAATELANLRLEAAKVPDLSTQLTTAQADVTRLKSENTQLQSFATVGKEALAQKLATVEKLYKLTVKNPDAAVLETFKKADNAALDGFLAQYSGTASAQFGATCKSCNSKEISFRSSWEKQATPDKGQASTGGLKASDKDLRYFREN